MRIEKTVMHYIKIFLTLSLGLFISRILFEKSFTYGVVIKIFIFSLFAVLLWWLYEYLKLKLSK